MAESDIDSIDDKVFLIYDDLTYKEVLNLEVVSTLELKPLLVVHKKNNGKTKSYFNNSYFAHSLYYLYDDKLQKTNFSIGSWSLHGINEITDRNRQVFYSISDPLGEIKRLSNLELNKMNWSEYYSIDGICNIIRLLRQLSHYPDWTYYDLRKANDQLENSIEQLNREIEKLKMKIKLLEGSSSQG